jgi:hypothetical protein
MSGLCATGSWLIFGGLATVHIPILKLETGGRFAIQNLCKIAENCRKFADPPLVGNADVCWAKRVCQFKLFFMSSNNEYYIPLFYGLHTLDCINHSFGQLKKRPFWILKSALY